MGQKRATYITNGNDQRCSDIQRFIEEHGVILEIRDVAKSPLSRDELSALIGHIPITYFINPASPTYRNNGFEGGLPDREEVLRLMVEDPTLLRKPITKTLRLVTVGCDRKRISEMLQLNHSGGSGSDEAPPPRGQNRRRSAAPSSGK